MYQSFIDELGKIASSGKNIGQLLSSLAERQGFRPSMFPSIKQVEHVATKNRGRAAEIASNVRTTLKARNAQAA